LETIIALILTLAVEYGLPPQMCLAIAIVESELNPNAIGINRNSSGVETSRDLGLFQLNSLVYGTDWNWRDPETNIRAGMEHIVGLLNREWMQTYWQMIVCYNAGTQWSIENRQPPASSLDFADRVIAKWAELEGRERPHLMIIRRNGRWY